MDLSTTFDALRISFPLNVFYIVMPFTDPSETDFLVKAYRFSIACETDRVHIFLIGLNVILDSIHEKTASTFTCF